MLKAMEYDDVTGEVRDQFGNWHESYEGLMHADRCFADFKIDEMKTENDLITSNSSVSSV